MKIPLIFLNRHGYIKALPETKGCLFTLKELEKMHYYLMYPSSGKLFALIIKAYLHYITRDVKNHWKTFEKHVKYVRNSHYHNSVSDKNSRRENYMNREILMEIMWLNRKPVVHIVDVEMNF